MCGRLSYVAGQVSFLPGGETDWGWATVNRPMTAGDSLWTGSSSRAEMHIGSTAIRMSAPTSVSFLNLDDRTVQIQLNSGTIDVRVPSAECGRMVTFPVALFTAVRIRFAPSHSFCRRTTFWRDTGCADHS